MVGGKLKQAWCLDTVLKGFGTVCLYLIGFLGFGLVTGLKFRFLCLLAYFWVTGWLEAGFMQASSFEAGCMKQVGDKLKQA